MNTIRVIVIVLIFLCGVSAATASGIEGKLNINTLQTSISTSAPQRGYLYFRLPGDAQASVKEWMDLKAVAGTGEAVSFGKFGPSPSVLRLRPETEKPTSPDAYSTNAGVVKLGKDADIVRQLQGLLRRK